MEIVRLAKIVGQTVQFSNSFWFYVQILNLFLKNKETLMKNFDCKKVLPPQ